MKYLLLNLLFWSLNCVAMPKDTLYPVRFVSATDSSPIYFAAVNAMSQGIILASWETDADGYIRINRKEISRHSPVLIRFHYAGFENKAFKADTLSVSDTLIISVKPEPVQLDFIQVVAYKVPMIMKPERPWRHGHKQSEKLPEPLPVYSVEQCLAYEALQKGLWMSKDKTTWDNILAWDTLNITYPDKGSGMYQMFQRYLMNNISYPKQARNFLMQESVYICFEFNEQGQVHYIQVMKGSHVDLVLEIANALARMPRINLQSLSGEYESYGRKRTKSVRMILPVRFILQ